MHETRTSISSEIKATKDMHYFVLYPEQTFSIGKIIIGCLKKRLNSKWYNTIKNINLWTDWKGNLYGRTSTADNYTVKCSQNTSMK